MWPHNCAPHYVENQEPLGRQMTKFQSGNTCVNELFEEAKSIPNLVTSNLISIVINTFQLLICAPNRIPFGVQNPSENGETI